MTKASINLRKALSGQDFEKMKIVLVLDEIQLIKKMEGGKFEYFNSINNYFSFSTNFTLFNFLEDFFLFFLFGENVLAPFSPGLSFLVGVQFGAVSDERDDSFDSFFQFGDEG